MLRSPPISFSNPDARKLAGNFFDEIIRCVVPERPYEPNEQLHFAP
jgi:hypothetical protein